jgi:hypothetical protein
MQVSYLSPAWWRHNEVSGDAVVPEVVVPGGSVARLNLVLTAKIVERGLSDMNSAATERVRAKY